LRAKNELQINYEVPERSPQAKGHLKAQPRKSCYSIMAGGASRTGILRNSIASGRHMVGLEYHLPAQAGKAAAALFGLLLGVYLLTSGGHFYAVDEEMMFNVTESLALHGSFALNPGHLDSVTKYSQYGPGQSIA